MHKHHIDSIEIMKEHYRAEPEIRALFLIGSVATGTERPDSDLDGVAVVSEEEYLRREANNTLCATVWGKSTYVGGYFDVHYFTREKLIELAENGTEPMRNMFMCAQTLYTDEPDLPEIVARIPVYPLKEKDEKQLRFYCTFKQYHSYYWKTCKPTSFTRAYVATGMVFNLYRLILLENEILFPSGRKLERTVATAPNKPADIMVKCEKFVKSLSDEDAQDIVESYENWTTYDYPEDFQYISNCFYDPNEWY